MDLSTGPVFDAMHDALHGLPFYDAYRRGALARAAFVEALGRDPSIFEGAGLRPHDVPFARRLPSDERACVDQILRDLQARGLLPARAYDERGHAQHARQVAARFDHGGRRTYIYPEEARLLFALVELLRPREVVFLGSYYGYWAIWALPGLRAHGGRATLVDVDPEVARLSAANIAALGYEDVARVVVGDAREVLDTLERPIDLAVVDAECPPDHPDPELRGKRIYHPLLVRTLPRLRDDATLLWHNILLEHEPADPFFTQAVARNRQEYEHFLPLARRALDGFVHYPTTEGVGVGWQGAPGRT